MKSVEQYWRKFSGPLLDRIDIRIHVENDSENTLVLDKNPPHPCELCLEQTDCENCEKVQSQDTENTEERFSTSYLRQKIADAILIQRARQGKRNARLTPQEVLDFCSLDRHEQSLLDSAICNNDFSQRAVSSILKLARTIADMEKSEKIREEHLSEAISLRCDSYLIDGNL
jgi:magnesium chelatase family protein